MTLDTRTAGFTLLAVIAFASNSLLTRLALGSQQIDAATFTAIRLGSGAAMLALLVILERRALSPSTFGGLRARAGMRGPVALFAYAAPFSFAYLRIGAAVGALVLFGVVQLTMIGYALFSGERPGVLTWIGIILAGSGLAILAAPSATRPDLIGLVLMVIAGIAWSVYTLVGKSAGDPLVANARSFLWSTPLAIVAVFIAGAPTATTRGITLAMISGALTSGVGYAIWYRALPRLSVTQAAVAQLTVPVIAALAAVGLLNERLSARLVLSSVAVLTGVALVVLTRTRKTA